MLARGVAARPPSGHDATVRVLHLVAADRWTGAAATALQLAEALRAAGVECHFAYRPGRGLEQRLSGEPWCHPALAKERSLGDLRAALCRVGELARGFDLVHAHLPHDHALLRLARPRVDAVVVRSIHHPGHLRPDHFHRWLFRGTRALAMSNAALLAKAQLDARWTSLPATVLPVALEPRFRPRGDRAAVRTRLGIPATVVVAGTIGKLVRDRGHAGYLRALAAAPGVWGMVIGKGPHLPALQRLAGELGIAERVVFPGYVEDGLESLYTAMDLFVFPAAGSDHAHRAIAEAAGCGTPAIAADLPGVRDLVDPGVTGALYPADDVAALTAALRSWAADAERRRAAATLAVRRAAREWTPARLSAAALGLYRALVH